MNYSFAGDSNFLIEIWMVGLRKQVGYQQHMRWMYSETSEYIGWDDRWWVLCLFFIRSYGIEVLNCVYLTDMVCLAWETTMWEPDNLPCIFSVMPYFMSHSLDCTVWWRMSNLAFSDCITYVTLQKILSFKANFILDTRKAKNNFDTEMCRWLNEVFAMGEEKALLLT